MEARGKRKVMQGIVVSDKSSKTRVVAVERTIKHPLYGRIIRVKSKFSVHDEKIAVNKKRIIQLIDLFAEYAPELYVSFLIDLNILAFGNSELT